MDGSLVLLLGRARALVLEALFRAEHQGLALHLRELARRTGLSLSAVQYELGLLRQIDLIKDIGTANRPIYVLNDEHALHGDLRAMFARAAPGLLPDEDHLARKRTGQRQDRRAPSTANSPFLRRSKT